MSAAHALHDLLQNVNERVGSSKSVYSAWQDAAGVSFASPEFAQFHAEAVALLAEATESVRRLDERSQTKYLRYLPAWWEALVQPRAGDWASVKSEIIDTPDLDMLWAFANLHEARSPSALSPRTPQILDRAVAHILQIVEEDTDLPAPVRDQIAADLRHILWLLENVETFGVEHAVAAVEKVTGQVAVAAAKTRSQRLKEAAAGLGAALLMVQGVTASAAAIADDVRSVFALDAGTEDDPSDGGTVQSFVVQIHEECSPRALTEAPAHDTDEDEAATG